MKSRSLSACLALSLFGLSVSPGLAATSSILPGQIKSGSITAAGQIDTYAFEATVGEVFTITLLLTNGPGTYPYWELYGPDSNVVAAVSGSPTLAYHDQIRLPSSGTYTIGVMDDTRSEHFSYLLGLQNACGSDQREAADGPEVIVPGQIAGGHIDLADVDSFKFSASANDVISIALLQTNGLGTYPWWQLYGPDCTLVAQVSSHPLSYGNQMRLPLTGTYTVLVLDNGLDETFDYQLSVHSTCGTNLREPGDGTETITFGQTTGGHVSPTDTDSFKFTASANDVVSIALLLTNGPGNYPWWQLYSPDCTLLTQVSGYSVSFGDQIRLPSTGTYTVLVCDNGLDEELDYQLSIYNSCGTNQREPGDGAENIAFGQFTGGHITPGDTDSFKFTASANEVISITLSHTNGAGTYPWWQLYGPDCVLLAQVSSHPVAYGDQIKLPSTGTYTILVLDNAMDEAFDYQLSVHNSCGANEREPDDGAETITFGQFTGGHVSPGDIDSYKFVASANEVISIAVLQTNGPGTYPYWQLYGPDCNLIRVVSDHPVAYGDQLRLPLTGTYTLLVLDGSLSEEYDYRLMVHNTCGSNQREPGDGLEAVLPGQPTGGHIDLADVDAFKFTASANDMVSITLMQTNGPGTYPYWQLYGPDCTLVTHVSSHPVAYGGQIRLPLTGTYSVLVLDGGLNEEFDYQLSVHSTCGSNQREPGDGAEAIAYGQFTGGHVGPGDIDSFKFTASANDVISVGLLQTNGPGTYPYWELYGPDCTLLRNVSEHPTAYADQIHLPFTGTYTVLVLDGSLTEEYDYRLAVHNACGNNLREPGDGPSTILPGQSTGGHIELADIDSYGFTASANDVVSIALLLTNGPGTYPYWQLYGPDCTLVAHVSSHPAAYAEQVRLPFTGAYTVLVLDGGLNEECDYVLSLAKNPGPNYADPGETNVVAPGQTLRGRITPGDLDAYAFPVIAGDSFQIHLKVTSGMGNYPALQLYGPSGPLRSSDCQPTSASVSERCVGETGTYQAFVLDNGLSEEFEYSLELVQWPVTPPSSGTNQYLAIYRCGDQHTYVRWSASATNYQLHWTESLEPCVGVPVPGNGYRTDCFPVWKPVTNAPYQIADHLYLNEGLVTVNRFYRLICTNALDCGGVHP